LAGDRRQRLVGEGELDGLHLEQALVLLYERVLGLQEDALESGFVEVLERCNYRQPSDELRDQAVLEQVFRLDVTENLAWLAVLRRHHPGGEADRGRTPARRDDLFESGERAAAHK